MQPVVDIMENESDHTIELHTISETIETTALHPFYTQEGWKDASEITVDDKILDKNKKWHQIKGHNFIYQKKKVFNFTVGNFHTYFVGLLALLVHNAQRCLSRMMLESQIWFQKVRRGYFFNLVWNSELRKQALEKGFKYIHEVKVVLKNGKNGIIDGLIKLKNGKYVIIERKASNLTNIADKTIKNYIYDASKYKGSQIIKDGVKLNKKNIDKVILHVEKVGELSKDVLDYAAKKGVKIVDDLTGLF